LGGARAETIDALLVRRLRHELIDLPAKIGRVPADGVLGESRYVRVSTAAAPLRCDGSLPGQGNTIKRGATFPVAWNNTILDFCSPLTDARRFSCGTWRYSYRSAVTGFARATSTA
jgi:hypothetical protein